MLNALLTLFETILNRYLQLDKESLTRLTALAGKVIAIEDPYLDIKIYMSITSRGVTLQSDYNGTIDTTLRGTPFALLKLYKKNVGSGKGLFVGEVDISGDIELGQKIQAIFSEIDVDWEEQLSHITGDVVAHQLGNWAHAAFNWSKESSESLQQNLTEYLQEEARYVPTRGEVEEFMQEVSVLRDDVERMELRIERLINE